MANKMTYVEALNIAIEKVDGETKERLEALKGTLEKRGSNRKPTKTQKANEGVKGTILEALAEIGKPASVTEILATGKFEEGTTNQKLTALLRQMVEKDGTVDKTVDKKRSYFAPAKGDEGEGGDE